MVAKPIVATVKGLCPMGCGETLFLGAGGHVTCSWHACPDPGRLDKIVNDPEVLEHIVWLAGDGFSIQHPLRERPQELDQCELQGWFLDQDGPPAPDGRYRVYDVEGAWRFEAAG
jgi:hypothetical protein